MNHEWCSKSFLIYQAEGYLSIKNMACSNDRPMSIKNNNTCDGICYYQEPHIVRKSFWSRHILTYIHAMNVSPRDGVGGHSDQDIYLNDAMPRTLKSFLKHLTICINQSWLTLGRINELIVSIQSVSARVHGHRACTWPR